MAQGVVAIVGSPNVGKSTIFNRMIGERHAIVDDEMGITRDRLYGQCEWLGRHFSLIDTGGIEIVNRPFQEQIRMQAEIAINEADVIVFVVDGKLGITTDDRVVTTILRKVNKPIILAVNKIDEGSHMADAQEFYGLGLGEPHVVSGAHGIGIGDILNEIVKYLPENSEELEEGLKCGLSDEDMDNEEYNARGSRYHGLTLPGFIDPQTHAIWVDVDTYESQPSGSTSYVNNGELNAIRTVIKALQKADGFQKFMDSQEKPEDKEIGIITFYGAQYGKIKEMYKDGKIDKSLPFRINVVDKFQGMERNIIIISTVRSNKEHRYGFAEDIRRINVGFSRARRLLIVVGNRQFFRQNAHYQRSIDEMEHFDIKQLQDLVR